MKAFLEEVARELFREHGDRLDELCLVFPSRRAGLFFNKYLGGCLESPVWSPSVLTIGDLMERVSGLEKADDVELITLLYREYIILAGRPESFDEFYYWGEIILNDFDTVDKYLVDAGDMFRNLGSLKEMERPMEYLTSAQLELIRQFWGTVSAGRPSREKQYFLDIWNILGPLYDKFTSALRSENLGYEGMIYRDAVDRIRSGEDHGLPAPTIVFVGFNALNCCETALATFFQNEGRALFYWDYDTYYTTRHWHEAGNFIRGNILKFPDSGKAVSHENLEGQSPEIEVIQVPSDSGQAQVAGRILEEEGSPGDGGGETAIVLADEELLMPVLHALPEDLQEINVTMGYPVSATPVYSLLHHLIMLQRNIRDHGGKTGRYHHEDVLRVIQHQYISLRYPEDVSGLVRDIHARNRIYIPGADLQGNRILQKIFRPLREPGEIAVYLLGILELITGDEENRGLQIPALELEFIFRIYTGIKRLDDILGRLDLSYGLPTFLKIFQKYLQRIRIPFSGEPLAGLQVMGVLETRVLDFDRVIILSMNEASFPKTPAGQSFIPYSLRKGFGLPTPENQDAIYAYYFYRLIQRASRVTLVYNSQSEGLSTGERSRYIYQLQYDPLFRVQERTLGFDVQTHDISGIRVGKSPGIMESISVYYRENEKGFLSPSALNTLINCSLRFYFRHVASLREPELLTEEMDAAMFGSLLHDVMKNIYEGLDWPVQRAEIDRIFGNEDYLAGLVEHSFSRLFQPGNGNKFPMEGRNLVIRGIIVSYAKKILEIDRESCPLNIHSLEKEYRSTVPLDTPPGSIRVRIGGTIDRIDLSEGTYRILDYKSGKGALLFRSVEDLFNGISDQRNEAAFQTMLYSKIFRESQATGNSPVKPGLYLARNLFTKNYSPDLGIGTEKNRVPVTDYDEYDGIFTQLLKKLLQDLFDPDIPFRQTEQEENCKYCEFKGICHKR